MDEDPEASEYEQVLDGELSELAEDEALDSEEAGVEPEEADAEDKPPPEPASNMQKAKNNKPKRLKKPKIMVDIGIDCEYQTVVRTIYNKNTKEKTKRSFNRILSYQWHGIVDVDGAVREWSGWHLPSLPADPRDPGKGSRIKLEQWVALAIDDGIKLGVVPAWPDRATIFSHFLRAELGSVRDFAEQKDSFQAIGGTIVRRGKAMELSDTERLDQKRYKPYKMHIYNESRNKREVKVRFVDTMLVTPARSGLAVAGGMIGLKKEEIQYPYSIEEMEEFSRDAPGDFKRYAMRDAEIAVKYGRMMRQFCKSELNIPNLTVTIAAMGLRLLEQTLTDDRGKEWRKGAQKRRRELFGYESIIQERFDLANCRIVKSKPQDTPVFSRLVREKFATEAYHGGRNESFMFGPTEDSVWTDYDLKAAYTTAMCVVTPLDYENAKNLGRGADPAQFGITDVGFARVRFNFSTATEQAKRFPCLPVRTPYGLIYPLQGETVATAPEIALAVSNYASVEILDGMIIPPSSEAAVFETFSAKVNGKRSKLKGTIKKIKEDMAERCDYKLTDKQEAEIIDLSAREKLWKEIGNSLYGKTAQGVKDKMEYDPRIGKTARVPPSDITNPFFAAQVTGYVRALLSEILIALPLTCRVVSATTDGFLCDMDEKDISSVLSGPLSQHYAKLRLKVFEDDKSILEVKHVVGQVISMRTRGQITSREIQGKEIVLARAGVKPDLKIPHGSSPDEVQMLHNKEMLRLFLTRRGGERINVRQLISLGEMWRTEADLVNLERERRLNLEYDFKRQPKNPRMVTVANDLGEHLALDTAAWNTIEEMTASRLSIDSWRVGTKERPGSPTTTAVADTTNTDAGAKSDRAPQALRTVQDFEAFDKFHQARVAAQSGNMRARAGQDVVTLAVRAFLRAFKKDAWGVVSKPWTHVSIAIYLTTAGFPVNHRHVGSAGRYAPEELRLQRSPRLTELMAVLLDKFPALEVERWFSAEDAAIVRQEVAELRAGAAAEKFESVRTTSES